MQLDINKYKEVRGAQIKGARTIEELKNLSDIVIENEVELSEIKAVLKNGCKCKDVSIATIIDVVNSGADTVEKVAEVTNAGTCCGRCKPLIANIIENKR